MLFKELDKLKRIAVMSTIAFVFIGSILLILPEEYIPFLGHALGFVLLVVPVTALLNFISSSKALIHYIYLSVSLLLGLGGVILFVFENMLEAALPWLAGILPALGGIYGIYHAIAFARLSGRKGWWVLIILSAVLMLFSVCAFIPACAGSTFIMMKIIGGALMFAAISSALRLIWLWPVRKEGN